MKNIIKKSNIFIPLAIMVVSFSGCGDKQNEQEANDEIIKSDTILTFEKYLKEHGEKIELEKIDTSDWQTYEDRERGFSFQYPKNWHVTIIDSSKSIEAMYSSSQQKIYKEYYYPDNPAHIKGQTEPFNFLCVISEERQKEREKNKDRLQLIGEYNDYCNIIFSENFTAYKGNKKSSGELWVESYLNTSEKYGVKEQSYFHTQNAYVSVNKINTGGSFIDLNDLMINFSSFDKITKEQVFSLETETLFQTIKYIK